MSRPPVSVADGEELAMLEIKTADELVDAELEARWAARRADRLTDVLQRVLRAFIERGGPIAAEAVAEAFPDRFRDSVLETLAELDLKDLIWLRDGRVDLAYPFSAVPTSFVVRLPQGQERYACCAIDALGVAPMLGEPVRIRSQCHHCGEPIALEVGPEGPGPDGEGLMVWVGTRTAAERRICTSL